MSITVFRCNRVSIEGITDTKRCNTSANGTEGVDGGGVAGADAAASLTSTVSSTTSIAAASPPPLSGFFRGVALDDGGGGASGAALLTRRPSLPIKEIIERLAGAHSNGLCDDVVEPLLEEEPLLLLGVLEGGSLVDDEAAAVLLAMRVLHASESCSAFSGGGSLSIGPGGTPTARAMSER